MMRPAPTPRSACSLPAGSHVSPSRQLTLTTVCLTFPCSADPELVFKYLSMTSKKTASAGPAWTGYMLLVMLAVAMDQSIIVPSIQHFMHSMGVLQEGEATRWASWALSSFPLVQAFATPLLSSLADYKVDHTGRSLQSTARGLWLTDG